MKPNRMTSIIAKSVAVLAACAALNASAGIAPAKTPVPPVEPEPSALFDSLGATLSVGYDSRLYYRGLWFADNTVTTAGSLAIPLISGGEDAGALTLNLGATYIATFETPQTGVTNNAFDYSEFDIFAGLTYDTGFAILGVQYQYYGYPDTYSGSINGVGVANGDPELGVTGANEVGITALIPIGALNLSFGYFYDLTIGGSYLQAAVDYTIPVTDWLSIVPALQAGYGFDYYTGSDGNAFAGVRTDSEGFTHLLMSVSAPIKLTKIATLTPYVAWNYGFDTRNYMNVTHDNEIFGGVKLSVAF